MVIPLAVTGRAPVAEVLVEAAEAAERTAERVDIDGADEEGTAMSVGAEVGEQKAEDSLELPWSYSLTPQLRCRRKIEDGRRDSTLECDDICAPPHERTCRAGIQRIC